jgi:hypothetical protein
VEHDHSLEALKQFLHYIGDKGLIGGAQAQAWRVAVGKILQDVSDAEAADVRKIDIDLALRKFVNRNPGKLSPNSLGEYKRRATAAIQEFISWTSDPTGYKPRAATGSRSPSSGKRVGGLADREKSKASTTTSPPTAPISSEPPAPQPAGGLPLPYPLRPDFLAQVVIPRDLTMEEAKRLGAFLTTLAIDFKG